MITDEICTGLVAYMEAAALPDLEGVQYSVRDDGTNLQYPAVVVQENGEPDEEEIVRGVYTVPVEVLLISAPEGDEDNTTHFAMNRALVCLLADKDSVKAYLLGGVRCFDVWGGQGSTAPEDGFRVSTFPLEIKAGPL